MPKTVSDLGESQVMHPMAERILRFLLHFPQPDQDDLPFLSALIDPL